MATTILFDLTRLFHRVRRPNCSGIDRVLLEQAQHFHALDEVTFCAWSGHELRRVPPWLSNLLLDHLTHRWQSGRRRKRGQAAVPLRWLGTRKAMVNRALSRVCRPLEFERYVGQRWIYVNVSHQHIDRVARVKAMAPPESMRTVVMLHDIMPITHPQFHDDLLGKEFHVAIEQISSSVDLVLTNSQTTSEEIRKYCAQRGLRSPELQHILLGGPRREGTRPERPPERATFVCLGTLSERKNIALLGQVWSRLSAATASPPELHLVGSPAKGYVAPAVLVDLPHVVWHRSLRDQELRSLLTCATALLAPSQAEGFGLPVLEALAHWVPVIASDLPAHREVGGDVIEYAAHDDPSAWELLIDAYSAPGSTARAAQLDRIEAAKLPYWSEHCEFVLKSLRDL